MKKLKKSPACGEGAILSAVQDALVFNDQSKHGDIPERDSSLTALS
jgi:hypothetical protein